MDEHPSVRLVAEHVHARIFDKYALVECVFFLRNEGPETIVEMGFPCYMGEEKRRFEEFRSYVDGQEVEIEIVEDRDQHPAVWYCKDVHFGEGELKVIRDTYRGGYGGNTMGDIWFTYILHTGASWKGTIGSVSIVYSLEDFGTDRLFRIDPAGSGMDGSEVRWALADYEPGQPRDVVTVVWNGWTPEKLRNELHRKAALGDIEGVESLLEQGIDINSTDSQLGKTPLCDALFFGAGLEMVEYLIESGAEVKVGPGRGLYISPVMAALWGHERFNYPFTAQVVELLLESGAEVHLNEKAIERFTGDVRRVLEDYSGKQRTQDE
jgi:hypothetical protein